MMKYAAAILMALALAGSGWAIVTVTRPLHREAPPADASPALDLQLKASDEELLHLGKLEKTLDQVNRLGASTPASATILAVRPSVSPNAAADKAKLAVKPDISLVYVSPDLQTIVINGKLLGVGDTLPSGELLLAIAQDHLDVERNKRRSVLQLPDPHALGTAAIAPTPKAR